MKDQKKIIIAIAGNIAAGKNEMAEYIQKRYRGRAYRSSEILRDILNRMHMSQTRENLQKASTMLRQYFGQDIISRVANLDLKKTKKRIIAINGVRRFDDLKHLRKDFILKLIFIDASLRNRFKRIKERAENKDDQKKSWEEFKKDHEKEAEKRIKSLRKKADYLIQNNGTRKKLYGEIDKILKIIEGTKK